MPEKREAEAYRANHSDRQATGAPSLIVPATFRQRYWSLWEALKNCVLNWLRYVIIATMFLYLLTAVLLFNDIIAFHDRVASDVGEESRARRVMLMLHRIHENPDVYPRDEQHLPIGALAVILGALQSTYSDLNRFGDFTVAESDGIEPLLEDDTNGDSPLGVRHLRAFKELRKNLVDEIDALDDYVADNIQEAAILEAVNELRENLKDFNGGANSLEKIDKLESGIKKLRNSIAGSAEEILAYDYLIEISATLRRIDIGTIDTHELPGQIERLTFYIHQLKRKIASIPNTKAERARLDDLLEQIEGLRARPVLADTRQSYIDTVAAMTSEVIKIGESLPLDSLTPKLHYELASMEGMIADFKQGRVELPRLDDALKQINIALALRFPAYFPVAQSIVEEIGHLRSGMSTLTAIVPGTYYSTNGGVLSGEGAKQFYRARIGLIGEHLNKIEDKLQRQGRVISLANVIEESEDETAHSAKTKANAILQNFDALDRFRALMLPFSTWFSSRSAIAQFGLNPQKLATLTSDSIVTIYVLLIGAIGSLIYVTKYQLKLVIDGHRLRTPPPRALPWLLFRPFFGVVGALALYFFVRAGQMAFGSGGDGEVGTSLNIPILSILALFAGILSWQILSAIEARGSTWFRASMRQPLWATGLSNALRTRKKSIAECAQQIGSSSEQVDRWLRFRDKVPIEQQDRIRAWIDMGLDELFSDTRPTEDVTGKPMWAVGLRAALDNSEKRIDAESLAELLGEETGKENVRRINEWIALKRQVPPATQWRLVDLLNVPHNILFASQLQNPDAWGTKLRNVIEDKKLRTREVAERLGLDVKLVHAWKELDRPVLPAMQENLMKELHRTFSDLFEPVDNEEGKDWFQSANDLAHALRRKNISREELASQVDVELDRVDRWIEGERIAKATRETIVRLLGDGSDLFRSKRVGASKPAYASGLKQAIQDQDIPDAKTLAEKVYKRSPSKREIDRVQKWIDQETKVSVKKQKLLVDELKTSHDFLFS